jgi:predicted nucleic acid-binding protein
VTFVVDASLTLSWCFGDESSPYADAVLGRLLSEDAIAPAIWPFEVANGLRTAERRGDLDSAELPRLRQMLESLPVRVESVILSRVLGDVLEAARSLELTAYDAAYLTLASERGLPLATGDNRLREACRRAGVERFAD